MSEKRKDEYIRSLSCEYLDDNDDDFENYDSSNDQVFGYNSDCGLMGLFIGDDDNDDR